MSICRQYVEALSDAEVTTVFIQGVADSEVLEGVGGAQVIFLDEPGENLRGIKFAQIFRLQSQLRDQPFDAVIAHRYKAIYLAGILSYFRDFPVLLGVAHEHRVFQRITRKLFVTFWRKMYRLAGVSKSVCDDIANRCPSLLTEDRLFYLPNVLPEGFADALASRDAARQQLGLAPEDYLIGTTGRLIKKKSLHVLLSGFAEYSAERADTKLVLLGDGPLRDELQQQAVDLGIEAKVKFMGHVPQAGSLVRAFDLFVLPSSEAEAFGLVLLEAMAAGVPVISSNAPGPSQVHGDQAWQFTMDDSSDLADKLVKWRELDAARQQVFIANNKRRVEDEFSPAGFKNKLNLALSPRSEEES